MSLKQIISVIVISILLSIVSSILPLSAIFPAIIAYFTIALIASVLTLLLVSQGNNQNGNEDDMEVGQVKWFNPNKGFGFITRDNGEEIFVHFRSISGKGHKVLREGQQVKFFVTENDKGLQAEEVISI